MTKNKLVLKEIEPQSFDRLARKEYPESNFLQSSAWAKSYQLCGDEIFFLEFSEEGMKSSKHFGLALAILKKAKRGRYLEIPGGPLFDYQKKSKQELKAAMALLANFAKVHKCVFVRMRPSISASDQNIKLAKAVGLVKSPMHLHAENTVMLDLTRSEDELLADMRRQTRYEVRRAAKLNIEVTKDNSEQAFNDFYDLQQETAKRQGFIPSSREFILAQREAFGEEAQIYTAKLDGKILAQGLIMLQKPEAVYNEAASTSDGRKYPGAYALQWQVIKDAKEKGIKRYNLFGIAPPNSPKHRYAGVTTFKTGFGGEQLNYLPAQDLVIKPLHYRFVHLLEDLRRKARHL